MDNKQLGILGEQKAAEFLKNKKYSILARNYRCNYGEIDIIAKYKKILVFVEVKTRRTKNYGKGVESVDFRKTQKIRKTALYYLKDNAPKFEILRFDVIDIFLNSKGEFILEHLVNAF